MSEEKQKYPYEALLEFCETKGPAFDAFMREWYAKNQPVEPEHTDFMAVAEPEVIEPEPLIAPTPKTRAKKPVITVEPVEEVTVDTAADSDSVSETDTAA